MEGCHTTTLAHARTHTHTHTHTHTRSHILIHTAQSHTHSRTYTHAHACTHTIIHTRMQAYTHTYNHTHTHMIILQTHEKDSPQLQSLNSDIDSSTTQVHHSQAYGWPGLLLQAVFSRPCKATTVHYRVYGATEGH